MTSADAAGQANELTHEAELVMVEVSQDLHLAMNDEVSVQVGEFVLGSGENAESTSGEFQRKGSFTAVRLPRPVEREYAHLLQPQDCLRRTDPSAEDPFLTNPRCG